MPMFSSIVDGITTPELPGVSSNRAMTLRSLIEQRKQIAELRTQQAAESRIRQQQEQFNLDAARRGQAEDISGRKMFADAANPPAAAPAPGPVQEVDESGQPTGAGAIAPQAAPKAAPAAGGLPTHAQMIANYGPTRAAAIEDAFAKTEEANQKLTKGRNENNVLESNYLGSVMAPVKAAAKDGKVDPVLFERALQQMESHGHGEAAQKLRSFAAEHPDNMPQIVDAVIGASPEQTKLGNEAATAKARADAAALAKLDSEATRPGKIAESTIKSADAAQVARPVLDASGNPTGATQGMTDKDRQALDLRAAEIRKQNTPAELAFAKNDPTKTPQERKTAADALLDLVQQAKASRPVTNVHTSQDAGALTPDDYTRAGTEYAITGVMPALGNGSGAVKQRLIHEKMEFARTSGLGPRDMALAGAAFKGDSKSLAAFQTQRDQIVSFEQTASKNLDQFISAASKIPDTGVPWLNRPLRLLDEKLVGAGNMAAVNAARTVMNNEIAKVTSGGGLGGVLSDAARKEAADYNPKDASFRQTLAVAKILKQDMANRHTSMDNTLGAIRGRMGTFGGAVAGGSGDAAAPAKVEQWKRVDGKLVKQ